MFALTRPDARAVEEFLERAKRSPFTYHPAGLSMMSPEGFDVDEIRVRIGTGRRAFDTAGRAIDAWKPLMLGWVDVQTTSSSPDIGTDVAVIARHLGFWSLNACRVVLRFPTTGDDPRHGFAYGTLSDHAECGEELFVVELDDDDESVWYHIRAVSKPKALLAKLGYPLTRRQQRRFREDSVRAMVSAVRD